MEDDDIEWLLSKSKKFNFTGLKIASLIIASTCVYSFFPRVLTAPFFAVQMLLFAFYAFSRFNLTKLLQLSSLVLLPYAVAFYFFQVVYQVQPFRGEFSHFRAWVGAGLFDEYFTKNGWGYMVSVLAVDLYLVFALDLISQLFSPRQDSAHDTWGLDLDKIGETGNAIVEWFYPRGWDVIVVAIVFLCLGTKGIVPFVMLLIALSSVTLPTAYAAKLSYFLFVIETVYLAVQFVTNIPTVITPGSETWQNIGFKVYGTESECVFFVTQTLLLFALALYIRLDLGHFHKKSKVDVLTYNEEAEKEMEAAINAVLGEDYEDPDSASEPSLSSISTSIARLNATLAKLKSFVLISLGLAVSVLVNFSYFIALILVYFCCLSKASVINFVFLLFFLCFFVSPQLAKRFWSLLVSYASLAVLVLYLWQLSWSRALCDDGSTVAVVIGLSHWKNLYKDMIYQALMLVFVLIQWRILDPSNTYIDAKGRQGVYYIISSEEPPEFVRGSKKYAPILFKVLSVVVFVVAICCVSLLSPITAVSIFYVLLMCVLVFRQSLALVNLSVVVTAVFIACRYAYQITSLSDYLSDHYPSRLARYLPLYDLGLSVWSTKLFGHFFPDVAMLVASVLFSRALAAKPSTEESKPGHLRTVIFFLAKLVYLLMPLAILVAAACTAVGGSWNVFSLVIVVVIIVCLPASRGNTAPGVTLTVVCAVVLLSNYGFNLTWVDEVLEDFIDDVRWLGVNIVARDGSGPKSGYRLSPHIFWHFFVMLFSLVNNFLGIYVRRNYAKFENDRILLEKERVRRYVQEQDEAYRMLAAFHRANVERKFGDHVPEYERIEKRFMRETADDAAFDGELLDPATAQVSLFRTGKRLDPLSQTEPVLEYVKWYVSNVFSVLRYPICLLLCCIALSARAYDLLGYAYLALLVRIVGRLSAKGAALSQLRVWAIYAALSVCILFQFVCALGLPPLPRGYRAGYDGLWPWNGWSLGMKRVFLLEQPKHKLTVLADLGVLLTLARLPIKSVGFYESLAALASRAFPGAPRTAGDWALVVVGHGTPPAVLLLLFIAGTARLDGMSLIYLVITVVIFMRGSLLENGRSKVWKVSRVINLLVILVQIVFYTVVTVVDNFGTVPSALLNACSFIGFKRDRVSSTISYNVVVFFVLAYHASAYSYLDGLYRKLIAADEESSREAFGHGTAALTGYASKTSKMWENVYVEKYVQTEKIKELHKRRMKDAEFSLGSKSADYAPRRTITQAFIYEEDFQFPPSFLELLRQNTLWAIDGVFSMCFSGRVAALIKAKEEREAHELQLRYQRRQIVMLEKEERARKREEEDYLKTEEELKRDELIRMRQNEIAKRERKKRRSEAAERRRQYKRWARGEARVLRDRCRKGDEDALEEKERRDRRRAMKRALQLPSRWTILLRALWHGCKNSTKGFCAIVMLLSNFEMGSIVSFALTLLALGYIMLVKNPKPGKRFWNGLSAFVILCALLKFIFSMPGFCMSRDLNAGKDGFTFDLGVEACPALPDYPPDQAALFGYSWPYLLGVQQRFGWFVFEAIWDVLLLVFIYIHKATMEVNGFWRPEMGTVRKNVRRRVSEFLLYLNLMSVEKARKERLKALERELEHENSEEDENGGGSGSGSGSGDSSSSNDDSEKAGTGSEEKKRKEVRFFGIYDEESETESEYSDSEKEDSGDLSELGSKRDRRTAQGNAAQKRIHARLICDSNVGDDHVPAGAFVDIVERQPDPTKPWRGEYNGKPVSLDPYFVSIVEKPQKHKHHHRRSLPEEHLLCTEERDVANLNRFVVLRKFTSLRDAIRPIYHYFNVMLYDPLKCGADLYTPLFVTDLIAFVFIFLTSSDFSSSQNADSMISSSSISLKFVCILIVVFAVLVIDRIVYVSKSIQSKLVIQYFTLVLYLLMVMWVLPIANETTFVSRAGLRGFFLIKCVYWLVSAHQIRDGYPVTVTKRFMMDGFTMVHYTLYKIYRTIPFLFEMRTILDWALSNTSLTIFYTFKFEAIYTLIYTNKCSIERAKRQQRKIGSPQRNHYKILYGVLLLLALCLLLWVPMFLLSSGGLATERPALSQVEVTVEFDGYMKLYEQATHSFKAVGDARFAAIRRSYPGIVKKDKQGLLDTIPLKQYSDFNWDISDPSMEELKANLRAAEEPRTFSISFTVSRESSTNDQLLQSAEVGFSVEQQHELLDVIESAESSTYSPRRDYVTIPGLVPQFVVLPGATGELEFAGSPAAVKMSCKKGANGRSLYWLLSGVDGAPVTVTSISAEMPISLASEFASLGLVGLYATYIVLVFGIVRELLVGSATQIPYEHMNNVDGLLALCEDLLLARQLNDMVLEESIFCELIEIFRSNERIIAATKERPDVNETLLISTSDKLGKQQESGDDDKHGAISGEKNKEKLD